MYVLGSCDHFIDLVCKHRAIYRKLTNGAAQPDWTLKDYGTLFVHDHISTNGCQAVMEFGCGFNTFFSDLLAGNEALTYASVDASNNTLGIRLNQERYDAAVAHRTENGHHHVDGFLGPDTGHLDSNSLDCIFSISVVEHIDAADMIAVASEAARLLRPGGTLINSVDIYHGSTKDRQWHKACREAGLEIAAPIRHGEWQLSGHHTTFIENQRVRYQTYNRLNLYTLESPAKRFSSQFATVLHIAQKPA